MIKLEIYTGETAVRTGGLILRTSPLGSCIAVAAYDPGTGAGGISHIMLPGSAPAGSRDKLRYSRNAVAALYGRFKKKGISPDTLGFAVMGGANVMRAADNSVSELNIKTVFEALNEKGLNVIIKSVGGFRRRVIELDLETGALSEAVGAGGMREVHRFSTRIKYIDSGRKA